jgi:hypothetical protein
VNGKKHTIVFLTVTFINLNPRVAMDFLHTCVANGGEKNNPKFEINYLRDYWINFDDVNGVW